MSSVTIKNIFFLTCIFTQSICAQEYASNRAFVLFPAAIDQWEYRMSAGVSITILPRPVAEEEIRQIPMLDAHLRFGLPMNFSLVSRLSSNGITNGASLGAEWSWRFDRIVAALGDQHSFWYGFSTIDGFDVDALGWINQPFIGIGITFDEFLIHLRTEAQFITYRSSRVGTTEVALEKNAFAGLTFAFIIEQPFFRQTHVALGVRMNYTNSAVQSWLAFSTIRDYQLYPEFIFGVIL